MRENRRLRVLTLIDGIGIGGGAEAFARQLTMRLDQDRFERILCVSRWTRSEAEHEGVQEEVARLRASGVEFRGVERNSRLAAWSWKPLVSSLRRDPVDILHAHKFGSNVWGALLARTTRTRVFVAHEHSWSFRGQPLRRMLDRELIARRANAFLAVSREDRRRMIEIERIDPDKVVFVPNGIPPLPAPSGRDLRAELGISPQDPVIGTVCVLRIEKALDVLIRGAAELREELPALRLLIVGEGPERPGLEALIAQLDLGNCVRLLGHRDDVPDLLGVFDVAVCTSVFEGSPLSVMEYMASGLPVVASRVGGIPDLIESDVQGLLVEPGDPHALADALASLLRDPDRARAMGERSRERQLREFSLDAVTKRVEQLYESLYVRSG